MRQPFCSAAAGNKREGRERKNMLGTKRHRVVKQNNNKKNLGQQEQRIQEICRHCLALTTPLNPFHSSASLFSRCSTCPHTPPPPSFTNPSCHPSFTLFCCHAAPPLPSSPFVSLVFSSSSLLSLSLVTFRSQAVILNNCVHHLLLADSALSDVTSCHHRLDSTCGSRTTGHDQLCYCGEGVTGAVCLVLVLPRFQCQP